jgi:hypothetical protein
MNQPKEIDTTLLQAMAKQEGFYASGTRPQRNHNPGDLEYHQFAINHGATGSDGRYAIFPDDDTGFAAMRILLLEHYKGLTLQQALDKYAPPAENETNIYLQHVCAWAECQPTDLIDNLL